jgi:hypothetical protein
VPGLCLSPESPSTNCGACVLWQLPEKPFQLQIQIHRMTCQQLVVFVLTVWPWLQLTPVGFSYLGGGDNGQGQNSMVRGVAQAPCPPGTVLQMLNADGVSEPGEDPRQLLNNYCVPCGVGTFCDSSEEGEEQSSTLAKGGGVRSRTLARGALVLPGAAAK